MSQKLFAKLNPDAFTLARKVYAESSPGADWVEMTEQEFEEWVSNQPPIASAGIAEPEPAPDWDQFRLALRQENGYAPAFQQAMLADPMAGIQLAIGLNTFRSNGDFSDFLGALVAALSTLPAEQGEHVAADLMVLSSRCNLPGAFIEAMQVLIANAAGNSSS